MVLTSAQTQVPEDEFSLIMEAQKDPRKFRPFYDLYYTAIFRFVLSRVREEEETADIVSSVFVKAISKINDFSYRGISVKSWLYKIARNEVFLHYRATNGRQTVSLDDSAIQLMAEETEYDLLQHLPELKKAMDTLDDPEMEFIQMKYYEKKSHHEISEILGITENNAKVRLHRIIQKLKDNFKPQSHE